MDRLLKLWRARIGGAFEIPEINVVVFAFLLHFVWEMQQMPLYFIPPGYGALDVGPECTQATFGDAGIALAAYWVAAALARSRYWMFSPDIKTVSVYLGVGLAVTVVFEALATGPLERWQYAESMPTLPVLGTGLSPFMQWIVIPPLILWFARRQIRLQPRTVSDAHPRSAPRDDIR